MTQLPVRFLASMFFDAAQITPGAESYTKLQEIFGNDIILGTMQQLTQIGMQNRIRFDSPQHGIVVSIETARINIEKLPTALAPNSLGSYNDFCSLCSSLFSEVKQKFNKKSNRLSFVSTHMIKDIPNDTLERTSEKVFVLPLSPFYNNPNEVFEWNCRLATKKDMIINEVNEKLNIVSTISRTKAQMSINTTSITFDGIQVEMDINTCADNTEYRFEESHIINFFSDVPDMMSELSSSINAHIGIVHV